MQNTGIYAARRPYPSLNAISTDPRFAAKLEPLRISKLNSISDYLYESIIFENVYPWLSTLLEGIANVEARHFKMLSTLISRLGGDPAINCHMRNIPIDISENTNSIAPRVARRILTQAISREKNTATEYRNLSGSCKDKKIGDILMRIAEDEDIHINILDTAYNRITV